MQIYYAATEQSPSTRLAFDDACRLLFDSLVPVDGDIAPSGVIRAYQGDQSAFAHLLLNAGLTLTPVDVVPQDAVPCALLLSVRAGRIHGKSNQIDSGVIQPGLFLIRSGDVYLTQGSSLIELNIAPDDQGVIDLYLMRLPKKELDPRLKRMLALNPILFFREDPLTSILETLVHETAEAASDLTEKNHRFLADKLMEIIIKAVELSQKRSNNN